jgi:hypothetical protein
MNPGVTPYRTWLDVSVLLVKKKEHQTYNFYQIAFQQDDDDFCLVLDQHA